MGRDGQGGRSPLQSFAQQSREQRACFPPPFRIRSGSMVKVFWVLGEISVCSLWMYIRSLWMAIRRLCTAIRNLQTEISACCQNNSSTLHRASQRAASAYAAHCVAQCSALRLSCDHGARRRVGWREKLGSAESFQSQGFPANGLWCGGVGPRRFHCSPERTVPMGCYARKAYATALSGS